jgi:NAD(P)-dependent dehydrogenase (short-subunit alcohol dehydrogenase family)
LFVNAGISGPMTAIGEVDPEPFSQLLLVNSLAPLRIIDRFADLVTSGGTVAVMSSLLGSIAANDSGGFDAYRISKAALNMGLRSIAIRRAETGLTFLAVHPGWVRTDMGGPAAPLEIEDSVPQIADMLEQRRGSGGIGFVSYDNQALPW